MKAIKSAVYNPCAYGDDSFSITVVYADGTKYTLYSPTDYQSEQIQRQLQKQMLGQKC